MAAAVLFGGVVAFAVVVEIRRLLLNPGGANFSTPHRDECSECANEIALTVNALHPVEYYSVNHGGRDDKSRIVIRLTSGNRSYVNAGYRFQQQGAVPNREGQIQELYAEMSLA